MPAAALTPVLNSGHDAFKVLLKVEVAENCFYADGVAHGFRKMDFCEIPKQVELLALEVLSKQWQFEGIDERL